MAYARKVDGNHKAVVSALRRLGWFVFDTSRVGDGFPDLIAARGGRVVFIEVKATVKARTRLSEAQRHLHQAFNAEGVPVVIIDSLDQVSSL